MPEETEPPPKKLSLKPAEFEAVNQPRPSGHTFQHDPMELLRMNRQHEITRGTGPQPAELTPPKDRFRRLRNYLLLLALGDGPLVFLILNSGGSATYVFGIAAVGLYTGALTWHIFVVRNDD